MYIVKVKDVRTNETCVYFLLIITWGRNYYKSQWLKSNNDVRLVLNNASFYHEYLIYSKKKNSCSYNLNVKNQNVFLPSFSDSTSAACPFGNIVFT